MKHGLKDLINFAIGLGVVMLTVASGFAANVDVKSANNAVICSGLTSSLEDAQAQLNEQLKNVTTGRKLSAPAWDPAIGKITEYELGRRVRISAPVIYTEDGASRHYYMCVSASTN